MREGEVVYYLYSHFRDETKSHEDDATCSTVQVTELEAKQTGYSLELKCP
jgi:heme oxygenase